jgi:hypothetical protein
MNHSVCLFKMQLAATVRVNSEFGLWSSSDRRSGAFDRHRARSPAEMRKAADNDGGERHAGGQEMIEQPPIDEFAVEYSARAYLDIGELTQSEQPETQDVRQEFRPETEEPEQQFGGVLGVKIIRQPHVENQQRHRDGEDSGAQRTRACFRKTWRFPCVLAAFVQKHQAFSTLPPLLH